MNTKQIPLEKMLWAKIRYYQMMLGISDDTLAGYLQITPRTMRNYDHCADSLCVGQIESFLISTDLSITDIIPGNIDH
jgi:hypothetical protein